MGTIPSERKWLGKIYFWCILRNDFSLDALLQGGVAPNDRSKCTESSCRKKIAHGASRIGKKSPSLRRGLCMIYHTSLLIKFRHGHSKTKWYHLGCVFSDLDRMLLSSKSIMCLSDIDNVDAFSPDEQHQLIHLIEQHATKRCLKQTRKGGTSPHHTMRNAQNHTYDGKRYMVCETGAAPLSQNMKPPDFILKLHSMLTENNQLISWDHGKVLISRPTSRLESKFACYFRHCNFTSFQRQLNNFGFHKSIADSSSAMCVYMRDDMSGLAVDALLRLRSQPQNGLLPDTSLIDFDWSLEEINCDDSTLHAINLEYGAASCCFEFGSPYT